MSCPIKVVQTTEEGTVGRYSLGGEREIAQHGGEFALGDFARGQDRRDTVEVGRTLVIRKADLETFSVQLQAQECQGGCWALNFFWGDRDIEVGERIQYQGAVVVGNGWAWWTDVKKIIEVVDDVS